ncbi:hypothetical protein [Lentibacillus salinarum]|uniref:Uncharacterized protein n=1 Tax=Lentibacillus salinarum TaxID=446820 RepID=A0ABW3ZZC0_9BACI
MSTSTVEKPIKGADLTEVQAVELAGEIEWTEAAVKEMKNKLKEYVKKHGVLETSDKVWEMSTTISWQFDPDTLRSMSQDIVLEGFNPWELLTLPKKSLDKLDWEEDVLAQYGTKKETSRFTSRKKD